MSVSAHLTYFDGRGKAEIIRLLLTACGVKFEETDMMSREQFLTLKPTLTFGQLPLLKLGDDSFVQSGSTIRTVARKFNLCGKTPQEMHLVDCYYEGTRDFFNSFMAIGFVCGYDEVVEKTKAALERYLPVYDKLLLEGGDKDYLVGGSLTFADLGLLEVLLSVKEYHGEAALEKFNGLKKFLGHMSKEKFYDEYMKNVRKPQNTPEYTSNVKMILNF